jgi:hypothetical protein
LAKKLPGGAIWPEQNNSRNASGGLGDAAIFQVVGERLVSFYGPNGLLLNITVSTWYFAEIKYSLI